MKGPSGKARKQFVQNLERYMKAKGVEQVDIVRNLNVSATTVSDWVNGKKYPRVDAMQELADYLGVTLSMLTAESEARDWLHDNAIQVGPMTHVPILGGVRAGFGGLAQEEADGYEFADVKGAQECFFLRVTGDSMAPQISEGDLALIRMQSDVDSGDLAVVLIDDDEGTIKKIIKKPGSIVLQSFNHNYLPRVFIGREMGDLRIIGKVMETKHKW